jgi:fucose permease
LTASRLLVGVVSDRVSKTHLLRVCLAGVTLGSILLSINVSTAASFFGLALIGFSLAPVFPMLISLSPKTVGSFHAPNAIGFQVAAAALGGAALPGLAGVLAARIGLEVIGPFLVTMALLMVLVNEVSTWYATARPAVDQTI